MELPIHIEQITPRLTWKLRQEVLYPNSEMEAMHIPEDESGVHFGAFKDNALIGVVSLFQNADHFQFRKFAITPSQQKRGYGSIILEYVTAFAQQEGAVKLWCNARVNAIDFYVGAGFIKTGNCFFKNGFEYEIVQKFVS
ncbi:MAG: GNAT family N-acetyltransferase [Sphingobacteriaceae bacterium]